MNAITKPGTMDEERKALLRKTICADLIPENFELFVMQCDRTGLDPFAKQIYGQERYDKIKQKKVLTIITQIDGYRLVADRTGCYAPGKAAIHEYDEAGNWGITLKSSTAFIKKLVGGVWHEYSATAFFREYVGLKKDGTPNSSWRNMSHIMLDKCAEALAIRKGFPAELSGIYTREEMLQADNEPEVQQAEVVEPPEPKPQDKLSITPEFTKRFLKALDVLGSTEYYAILKEYNVKEATDLLPGECDKVIEAMNGRREEIKEAKKVSDSNKPDPENDNGSRYFLLKAFKAQKERVGTILYYRVMEEVSGKEHANEIGDNSVRMDVLDALKVVKVVSDDSEPPM